MNEQMNSSFEESVDETENLMFFGKRAIGVRWNTEQPCPGAPYA